MSFKNIDSVYWNGRKYFPHYPPRRQPDAEMLLARRLGSQELGKAAKAIITEVELQNFAKVYPRLYQVADVSQRRLRAWAAHNKDAIKHWDVGDFFKTAAADKLDRTKPRKPGCPPEVMKVWRSEIKLKIKNKGVVAPERPVDGTRNYGTHTWMPSLTGNTQTLKGYPEKIELPPVVYIQDFHANYKPTIEKLSASLRKIKTTASRLEWLSGGLDSDDLVRKEMLALAQTLKDNADGAESAMNAILQHPNKPTIALDSYSNKPGNDLVVGTRCKEDDDKDQRHVKARGAHKIVSVENEWDINCEHGTFVSSPNEGAISTECQTNHQGNGSDHSSLDLISDPIGTPNPQFDMKFLNVDQMYDWDSFLVDEQFNNLMLDQQGLELFMEPMAV
jgi:hypothetical protein